MKHLRTLSVYALAAIQLACAQAYSHAPMPHRPQHLHRGGHVVDGLHCHQWLSFAGHWPYAKFAKYLQRKFELSTRVIDISISILFFAFAAYHIFKQIYLVYFKHH